MSQVLNYKEWINYNFNITELKDANAGIKLLKHMLNNKNRKTGQEFLNKKPELENVYEGLKPKEILDLYEVDKDKLPKGGKGSKPFRFITSTLNVEPTKENKEVIQEWYNNMKKMYEGIYGKENILAVSLHLNESRPGIHICLKNWDHQKKKYGVYNKGIKIPMSGEKGRDLVKLIWNKGAKQVEKLAEKYDLEYRQEATTNLSKEIEQVRKQKVVIKKVLSPEIKEIQKEIFQPIMSEAVIKQTKVGLFKLCWAYDPSTGANHCLWAKRDLYGKWEDYKLMTNWDFWASGKQEIINWGKEFKEQVIQKIMNIDPASPSIKALQDKIKSR